MFKDFLRRLPLSRSNSYVLVSILIVTIQVIIRALLFYVDNQQSGDTTLAYHPQTFPTPPPFSSLTHPFVATANGTNGTSTDVSTLLFTLRSRTEFEVCTDTGGPCETFLIDEIASISTSNSTLNFCAFVEAYAQTLFRENRLEDAAFIGIHLYLLFVTVYAIARESIPHIIVLFATRVLSLAWALGRVIESAEVKKSLASLFGIFANASGDGSIGTPCNADNTKFFAEFWRNRQAFEYALLGSSVLMILLEAFTARRLVMMYTQRPWRVVQVPRETRKMYKLLLGFSVLIQLAAFILPTTMVLFVVVLLSAPLNSHSDHTPIYLGGVITTVCLLPLWVFLGWRSLRREYKKATIVFLLITTVFLGGWSTLFDSRLFRWTFSTWWFLGTMMTASLLLLLFTLVLAVCCRLNFGKGLDHYLQVQTALTDMNFAHDNFEKDHSLDLQAAALKRSDSSSTASSVEKFWDNIDLEVQEQRTQSFDEKYI